MSPSVEPVDHPVPQPFGWVLVDAPAHLREVLDQVAVGPGGVLAIARWTTRVGVRRGTVHPASASQAVDDVVLATTRLAEALQPAHRPVTAALVVVPGDRRPTRVSPGAVVVGEQRFTATLAGLGRHLGPDDAADVRRRLAAPPLPEDDLPTVATLTALLQADRERNARAHRG
ncbi:hypothetical protein [Actinotalea sp.]|uniref:hypothetical protein n=1 Tax=Actinotalea sp. TaxID=1872145 RepID=UPI00356AB2B6